MGAAHPTLNVLLHETELESRSGAAVADTSITWALVFQANGVMRSNSVSATRLKNRGSRVMVLGGWSGWRGHASCPAAWGD